MYESFNCYTLDPKHVIWQGDVPDSLALRGAAFDALWQMHPSTYRTVVVRDKSVKQSRWEESYPTESVPGLIEPLLAWVQATIDPRLNSVTLNWYDGHLGHFLERRRDATTALVKGSPIVTLTLGDSRVYRLRPWLKSAGLRDFRADHGTAFILPRNTNSAWTHEVPAAKTTAGRHITITFQAIETVPLPRKAPQESSVGRRSLAMA